MPLRIGVVTGAYDAEEGGGGTLTATLSAALKSAQTSHEFLLIDKFLRLDSSNSPRPGASEVEAPSTVEIPHSEASEILQQEVVEADKDQPIAGIEHGRRQSAIHRRTSAALRLLARSVRFRFAKEATKITNQAPPLLSEQTTPEPREPTVLELLEKVIDRERLDLVWYMIPNGFPVSVPFVTTVWDLEHRKQPYFPEVSVSEWTWAERELNYGALLPRASVIITGTVVGKTEVVKYYGVNADNVKVIPFPVPPVDLKPTANDIRAVQEEYGRFLLYPAQYWPHKNHVNLLLSLAILRRERGFRPSLVLTGSDKGNQAHVRKFVQELNLSEQVFDLGFVSRQELNCLYMGAVALVFPSFFGPDNLPPIEAFALGCPVVAADIPGAREELDGAALYFDPSNPDEIAARISEICCDADCRRRLVEEGATIIRQRTPQVYISEICKVLDGFEAIRRCWGQRYEPTRAPPPPAPEAMWTESRHKKGNSH